MQEQPRDRFSGGICPQRKVSIFRGLGTKRGSRGGDVPRLNYLQHSHSFGATPILRLHSLDSFLNGIVVRLHYVRRRFLTTPIVDLQALRAQVQGNCTSSAGKTEELGQVGQMPASAFPFDFQGTLPGIAP